MESSDQGRRLEKLIDQARAAEQAHGNRKHHLVPATYLERWEEAGQVRVTDLETHATYCARPDRVGRVTDFYRLEADGIDPEELPPLALEVMLGEIEGGARPAIDKLIEGSDPDPLEGLHLAWFIALQVTRGHAFRDTIRAAANELARLEATGMDATWVRRRLRERGSNPSDAEVATLTEALEKVVSGEYRVGPQDAALAGAAAEVAAELVPLLLRDRHWILYETPSLLVTCDEPVVVLGGPATPRGEQAGIGGAPVVFFPLSPSRLLLLLRGDLEPESRRTLDTVDVADVNRELIASAWRWVFEKPSRRIGTMMQVPPRAPGLMSERVEVTPEDEHVVVRQHRPTRWASDPSTPWPVDRWWRVWE